MTVVDGSRRRNRLRSALRAAVVALVVVALVLAVLVWRAAAGVGTVSAEPGETYELRAQSYGRTVAVQLPHSEVRIVVGAPVTSLDHLLVDEVLRAGPADTADEADPADLAAPDGGRLVPVSWTSIPRDNAGGGGSDVAAVRLVVRAGGADSGPAVLVHGDEVTEPFDTRSIAVAVAGEVGLDDLAVEVEHEGLTQTADVGTGEVDAGVARPFYEPQDRDVTAGCSEVPTTCDLQAAPDSALRPTSAGLTTSNVSLYPWDDELGWAEEGTLWAGVRLQLFGAGGVVDAAGGYASVDRQGAPEITLDGADPVLHDGLAASTLDSYGRVVFSVDAQAVPRELLLEQVLTLGPSPELPDAPAELAVSARLELAPVG